MRLKVGDDGVNLSLDHIVLLSKVYCVQFNNNASKADKEKGWDSHDHFMQL